MVRKVLSLYKAGTRLTKQSFRDEDEQDLSEIEDEENEEDPYEHVGNICKSFMEKKAFTDSDGHKKISNKYRNELKEFLKTVTDRFFSKFFPNRTMKTHNDYIEKLQELASKVRHLLLITYTKSFFKFQIHQDIFMGLLELCHPLSNDRIPLISPSMIVNEIMNIHKHRTCHQNLQVKQVLGSDIRRGRPALNNWKFYRDLDQKLRFTSSEAFTQDRKRRNTSSFNSNNNTIIINSGNY
jgi:hypothetical protein